MDAEIADLLERQGQWQKGRKDLSWPEKIRIAETMRETIVKLRAAQVLRDETRNGDR